MPPVIQPRICFSSREDANDLASPDGLGAIEAVPSDGAVVSDFHLDIETFTRLYLEPMAERMVAGANEWDRKMMEEYLEIVRGGNAVPAGADGNLVVRDVEVEGMPADRAQQALLRGPGDSREINAGGNGRIRK